jgi:4'-phosphopantetheinyl transferase
VPAPAGLRLRWAEVPDGMPRRDVAHALVQELAPGARIVQRCPRCGGAHGPLRLEGVPALASATYTAGWAIVAVLDAPADAAALGIDAEPETEARPDAPAIAEVLGRPHAGPRDWTRVEAALKADGRGLRVEPSTVMVTLDAGDATWSAGVPGGDVIRGWDVGGPPGTVVSVAIRSAEGSAAASGRSTR